MLPEHAEVPLAGFAIAGCPMLGFVDGIFRIAEEL